MSKRLSVAAKSVFPLQGSLRIAHCGGLHSDFDVLIQSINVVAKLLGHPIQWDTETVGCDPSLSSIPVLEQRLLHDALAEVWAWLDAPENAGEFLIIYFDDQIDLQAWVWLYSLGSTPSLPIYKTHVNVIYFGGSHLCHPT